MFRTMWVCAGLVGLFTSVAQCETFQALSLQNNRLYGEATQASEADKLHYFSRGQEYLRNYLRGQVLREMKGSWLELDEGTSLAELSFGMEKFYPEWQSQLQTKMRIFATEDLNQYLYCGRYLPVEVEVNSDYRLTRNFQINAKLEAPFDNLIRIHLGSQIEWTKTLHTLIQYQLCNGSRVYDGMTLGVGWNLASWQWKLNYEITSELVQIQHLSLTSEF